MSSEVGNSPEVYLDVSLARFKRRYEVKKNFGPILEELQLDETLKVSEENFVNKINPVYKAINYISKNELVENKNTIGFVGAPWTLLVYMINLQSPKKGLKGNFFKDNDLIKKILQIIDKFLKIHVKNQIENGANIIQIFDSWAGLLEEKDYQNFIYEPTISLVNYVKSFKVPLWPASQNHSYQLHKSAPYIELYVYVGPYTLRYVVLVCIRIRIRTT